MKKLLLSLLFLAPAAFAVGPLFSLVPVGTLPTTVTSGGTATAEYTVTNNAPYTLQALGLNTLPTGQTPAGVTQNTVGAGLCANPFSLDPGASCILSLTITADALENGAAVGGPEVCFTKKTPSRCSIPNMNVQLNVTVVAAPLNTLLYVVNNGNTTVSKCAIDLMDGTFTACSNSGATGFPGILRTISFASSSGQNYAYVGQGPQSGPPFFYHPPYQCIAASNGDLSGCTGVTGYPASTDTFDNAFINPTNPIYAYVSDNNSQIRQCTLIANLPSFSTCINSGAKNAMGMGVPFTFITFQTIAGMEYAYVPDSRGNIGSVYQYSIEMNGNLSLNNTSAVTFADQIAFAEIGGNTYVYIVQELPGMVIFCSVDNSGTASNGRINFGSCTQTSVSPFVNPIGIVTATFSGVNYVYVGDFTLGKVFVCTLDSLTGDFASCPDAGAGIGATFNKPYGLALD